MTKSRPWSALRFLAPTPTSKIEPTYAFGHGHSYAEFRYGTAESVGDAVSVTVENSAERPGREVVQAYVRPPAPPEGVERPVRELAGTAAVELDPGERRTVEIDLQDRALARYDPDHGWVTDSGTYTVEVGRSSRDARATVETAR